MRLAAFLLNYRHFTRQVVNNSRGLQAKNGKKAALFDRLN
jgi:hypothetical protein